MAATLTTAMSPTESATSNKDTEPTLPDDHGVATRSRFWQLVLILLALEIGLFLIFVPWSAAWDEFFLPSYFSPLRPILRSHYVRGALSGLGLINLWISLDEALGWSRRAPLNSQPRP